MHPTRRPIRNSTPDKFAGTTAPRSLVGRIGGERMALALPIGCRA